MDFSNKRRRDDNDSQDFKRARVSPILELITKLIKDICEIGESSANLMEGIEYMSRPIAVEVEKEDDLRIAFLNAVYALVIEQPHKMQLLSALIQLSNAKNFLVGKYVLEFLHQKCQDLIDTAIDGDSANTEASIENDCGLFNKLKLLLRFFATLSPIISDYQIINIFKQFLNLSIELQSQSDSRNGLAEQLHYNILISIPYLIISDLSTEMKNHCNNLIELSQNFIIKSEKISSLFNPFDESIPAFNLLQLTKDSINNLQNKDWELNSLIDINESIAENLQISLENNTISNQLVKHSLPQLNISIEKLSKLTKTESKIGIIDSTWDNQRNVYQIFTPSINTASLTTQPDIHTYESLLLKDIITDIITNMEFNRKEIANQLLLLDLFFKPVFAPSSSTIDKLISIAEENKENDTNLSTWKLEDVIIDNILSLIFTNTNIKLPSIHYYIILIECCLNQPSAIAPVLGRGIRFFYNHLTNLSFELRVKFIDWFSIQLNNFNFTWKWIEWEDDSVNLFNEKYHPKHLLFQNLILKEIQLSNKAKIESTLIPEFKKYLNFSILDSQEYDLDLFNFTKVPVETNDIENIVNEIKYDYLVENFPYYDLVLKIIEYLTDFNKVDLDFDTKDSNIEKIVNGNNNDGDDIEMDEKIDEKIEETEVKVSFIDSLSQQIANVNPDTTKTNEILINLIYQSLCFIGSRSISHIDNFIIKNLNVLKKLNDSDNGAIDGIIINSILRFWNESSQISTIILTKLIKYELLTVDSLITKIIDDNLVVVDINFFQMFIKIVNRKTHTEKILHMISDKLNSIGCQGKVTDNWEYLAYFDMLKMIIRENVEFKSSIDDLDNEYYKSILQDGL